MISTITSMKPPWTLNRNLIRDSNNYCLIEISNGDDRALRLVTLIPDMIEAMEHTVAKIGNERSLLPEIANLSPRTRGVMLSDLRFVLEKVKGVVADGV